MPTAAVPVIRTRISRVPASDAARWQEHLDGVPHDFYHSAAYHRFCEETGGGQAFLARYEEGGRRLLWPYLLRAVEGFGCAGLRDVTSVYGYAGPLGCPSPDPAFLLRAWRALADLWRSDGVVCAFTRLHPLLENHSLLPATCPPRVTGQTVSIDLRRPPGDIWRDYRKSLRYDIRAARAAGVVVEEDVALSCLEGFSSLYLETMTRNGADAGYLFDYAYFRRLFRRLGGGAHLMTARCRGRLIAGAVFAGCGDSLQYHFSATAGGALHHSPAKLLLDEIRLWGQARNYKVLHLGGGRGSRADSLFSFKAGFSRRRHAFYTWRSVLEPSVYEELSTIRRREIHEAGSECEENFFPLYRSPRRVAALAAAGQ